MDSACQDILDEKILPMGIAGGCHRAGPLDDKLCRPEGKG